MKKKFISLCLVAVFAATAAVGGTLAYFTDTDEATNTFTVGNVTIDLIEQQRGDKDGNTTLVDFENNKKLYPIVGSAQGEKDEFGLPTAKNYVDKVVTVKNTGSEDAYIRAYFAIPSALDDGYDTFNAGLNILHFNFGKYYNADGKLVDTYDSEWSWKQTNGKWNYYETTIDGIAYNVYFADYYKSIAKDETTTRLINGVYLDANVDAYETTQIVIDENVGIVGGEWPTETVVKYTIKQNGEVKEIDFDLSEVECPVYAVAVQAEGFDNAKDAVEAAFGAQYNPWGGTVTNWQ